MSGSTTSAHLPAGWLGSGRKAALYAADPVFAEAAVQALGALDDPEERMRSHALLLLKPDLFALGRAGAALDEVLAAGFAVRAVRAVRFTAGTVRELWRHWLTAASPELLAVLELYLRAAPSLALLLARAPANGGTAAEELHALKGPAAVAARAPGHLRAKLGAPNGLLTAVHAADDVPDLVRELGALFSRGERAALLRAMGGEADAAAAARSAIARLDVPRHPLELGAARAAIRAAPGWRTRPLTARALLAADAGALPLWDRLTVLTACVPDVGPSAGP